MSKLRSSEHAVFFGAYLGAMTAALALAGAWGWGLLFVAMLGALARLARARVESPGRRALMRECAFLAVAMNVSFQAMAFAVPAARQARYDADLFVIDQRLFGGNASLRLEPWISPALTEILSACYMFFIPLLFFGLVRYFFWRKDLLAPMYRGLFTIYGIGFLGYLLVPAAGPYLAYAGLFHVPLEGGVITRWNAQMVHAGSNGVDVFPSLHCAVSAYLLGFSYRHDRREFRFLLLPVIGLWVSTIYLRYHYLIDVLCGFALALLGLAIAFAASVRRESTS